MEEQKKLVGGKILGKLGGIGAGIKEKFLNMLQKLKDEFSILWKVEFTGGEPLMHMDIKEYIKQIKDLGFLVKVDTNGSFPDRLKDITGLVDYIAMDIKAPLPKYEIAIGKKIDTELIKESISIIMDSQKDYEFRTTIFKNFVSSDEDMLDIGSLIKGAKLYYLQSPRFMKVLDPSFPFESYTLDALRHFAEILKPFVENVGIR